MLTFRNNFALYHDFYSVAKMGSFSKTANEIYISQPTLSRNIKKLEEILNKRLINRLVSGIELTKEGKELFALLDDIFEAIKSNPIIQDNNDINGKIIIGTTENIMNVFLSTLLPTFCLQFPTIKFGVVTSDSTTLYQKLRQHEIDILLDYLPFNDFDNDNFLIKPVGNFQTCFACSKKFYKDNKIGSLTLEEIQKLNFIIPGSSRRRQLLDDYLVNNNIFINPLIEVPNSNLMYELVKNDIGIGYFIKGDIIDNLNDELNEVKLKSKLPINTIGLIYSNKYTTVSENIFIQYLIEKSSNNF